MASKDERECFQIPEINHMHFGVMVSLLRQNLIRVGIQVKVRNRRFWLVSYFCAFVWIRTSELTESNRIISSNLPYLHSLDSYFFFCLVKWLHTIAQLQVKKIHTRERETSYADSLSANVRRVSLIKINHLMQMI